ncbi:hydrolase, partial [Intestinimonas butyriciproducens]|nr:hydrolase [Intestinimonas butyriciproducens]
MKHLTRPAALVLSLALTLSLAACAPKESGGEEAQTTPVPSAEAVPSPSP